MKIEEYRKLTKKRNKYNAKKTLYNGRLYDSRKEAKYAEQLDTQRFAKNESDRVVRVQYQPKFSHTVNGTHCFNYVADFKVGYSDGSERVFDVKGYKKGQAYALFRLKKKCVEAQYGIEITEI